ncbi:MAG: glycosyltransferase, partial [Alphaproteobacteria bacterium]|nr:glycosyltransferase [Alphaproteobacteria bacterium]
MRILFVHQSFPAQYKHLVRHFADQPGNEVVILRQKTGREVAGVRTIIYQPDAEGAASGNRYVGLVEPALRNAQAVLEEARKLQRDGFRPDIMIGHNAWGETLFLKEVWPDTPLLSYFEFFYRPYGADLGFDPEFPPGRDARTHSRIMNTVNLLGLQAADWGQSPTFWQRQQFPEDRQKTISVIHDGIDTDFVLPWPTRRVTLPNGRDLSAQDEVVTYVSRSLEPYRGFHIFMRALPEILRRRPKAQILVVGAEGVSYGPSLSDGRSFKQALLDEQKAGIDLNRVHFLGHVTYEQFLAILQVSSVHIYLTYPFVLSWSMLEAMSAGCLVVGSATPPVKEVIQDGINGLLVDFFSHAQIADRVDQVLDHPDRMAELRRRARQTIVERYDLKRVCLPRHLAVVEDLVNRRTPSIEPVLSSPAAPLPMPPAPQPRTMTAQQVFAMARQAEQRGESATAERLYREIIHQSPQFPEVHYRLGLVLHGQGRHADAAEAIERAAQMAPEVAYYHCDLGVMYRHLKQDDRRLACYRRATELDPNNAVALVNLASALNDIGEVEQSEAVCRRAAGLNPQLFSAYLNLGGALMRQNRLREAKEALTKARDMAPDYPEHGKNLGMCMMLMGEFVEGAKVYEQRMISQIDKVSRDYPQPLWDGGPLAGRTVFLYSEQGLGDTLNFVRYVPLVKARGGRVIVECQAPLLPLVKRVAGADEVIAAGMTPPRFDCYRSLVSLPHVFGHDLGDIPAEIPYLSAPEQLVATWRARL